jgi:hypothetical protein
MAWTYDNQDWARFNNGRIELKNADGSWSAAGTPEHSESAGYVTTAANSPEVDKLVAYARAGGTLNPEQQAFMANPLLGMDSFGQSGRWGGSQNLFDNSFDPQQSGALQQFGLSSYVPQQYLAAGQQFNQEQSPAAQSARDDSGGLFGGMDIGTLAMLAAAIYTGGAAGGLWGGLGEGAALAGAGEAATLGSLGSGTMGVNLAGLGSYGTTAGMAGALGSGLSGTTLASLGLDYGALAGLGAAGAAGSTVGGNMFELGDLTNAWSNAFGEGGGWNPLTDGYGMGDAASGATSGGLDLSSLYPDFTNYSGQMSQIPGLEQSLTQIPMDFSAGSALAQPGIWDTIKQIAKTGGDVKSALSMLGITGSDAMKALGSLGAAGLGAYASNQQTNALEAQAQRYEGYGAPYRQKLSDLYKDPTSFLSSPEVRVPVDQGTSSLMRSLSTQGNPFGSGNALQQGQSYASDQLFGKLGQEKDRLAGFGGLSSYNQAAPQASTNAINSSSNAWNAVGAGANNIFNPPQTQAQTMAEWAKAMRGGV